MKTTIEEFIGRHCAKYEMKYKKGIGFEYCRHNKTGNKCPLDILNSKGTDCLIIHIDNMILEVNKNDKNKV